MNKSEQYEYFQALIKTCDKLDKAFSKDKTTDAIISDITDPDSKPAVIQNQGNPTSTSMTKCSNMLKSEHKKGDRIVHDVHGAGTVKENLGDGNHLVNFDNAGIKEGPKKVHSSNFKQKEMKKDEKTGNTTLNKFKRFVKKKNKQKQS